MQLDRYLDYEKEMRIQQLQKIAKIFTIPEFLLPWIDRFIEPLEAQIILYLKDKTLNAVDIQTWLRNHPEFDKLNGVASFLQRSCKRGILQNLSKDCYKLADFHIRYDRWALFEGWKDVPKSIQTRLNEWESEFYQDQHIDQIQALAKGAPRDEREIWPEYVLLDEALALIDKVNNVFLWPCNCRSMMQLCSKPVYNCLRFEDDSHEGWEISAERAKEIIVTSHKKGLMQSAEIGLGADGKIMGGLCNCCSDCCFPQQLAKRNHVEHFWPLSRYVVNHYKERCSSCGKCTKRCPFKAFSFQKADVVEADDAIEMIPGRNESNSVLRKALAIEDSKPNNLPL